MLWGLILASSMFLLAAAIPARFAQLRPGPAPAQLIPGVGIGGLMSYIHFLVNGRQTTNRYLRKYGLARPLIAWREWQDVIARAKQTG